MTYIKLNISKLLPCGWALIMSLTGCSTADDRPTLEQLISRDLVAAIEAGFHADNGSKADQSCRSRVVQAEQLLRYVELMREEQLARAREALNRMHFNWSCLGMQDFAVAYRSLTETLLDENVVLSDEETLIIAPVMFLVADQGGRYLDNAVYKWMLSRSELLLDASQDSEVTQASIELYISRPPYVQLMSVDDVRLALGALPYLARSTGSCSFGQLATIPTSGTLFCPDECTWLLELAELEQFDTEDSEIVEYCESIGRAEGAGSVGGNYWAGNNGDITNCVSEYANTSGQPACVLGAMLEQRGSLLAPKGVVPTISIDIGNDCTVMQGGQDGSDDGGDNQDDDDSPNGEGSDDDDSDDGDDSGSSTAEPVDSWTEEDEAELQQAIEDAKEAKKELNEAMEEAENRPVIDAWLLDTLGGGTDRIDAARKKLQKATERIKKLADKKFGNNQSCLPEQPCSNQCGPTDNFARQFAECHFPDSELDPEGGQPEPVDPPESAFGPEIGGLQRCLLGAMAQSPDLGLGEQACATVMCADGSTPAVVNGICVCQSNAPADLPAGPGCETVILCERDQPCSCDGRPVGETPGLPSPVGPILQFPIRNLEVLRARVNPPPGEDI